MYQDDEIKEIESEMRLFSDESLHDCYSINLSDEDFQIVLEHYDLEHLITENKIILFRKGKNIRFEVDPKELWDPWVLADFGPEIKTFLDFLHRRGLLRKIPNYQKPQFPPGRPIKRMLNNENIDLWAAIEVFKNGRDRDDVYREWQGKCRQTENYEENILSDERKIFNSAIRYRAKKEKLMK
jgi:hypothetical protein